MNQLLYNKLITKFKLTIIARIQLTSKSNTCCAPYHKHEIYSLKKKLNFKKKWVPIPNGASGWRSSPVSTAMSQNEYKLNYEL